MFLFDCLSFQLVEFFFEFLVLRKNHWTAIKKEKEDGETSIEVGCPHCSCNWSDLLVQFWSNIRRNSHGWCINNTICIINTVIKLTINSLIFTLNNGKINLKSLKHLWNNWNENKCLEKTKKRECKDDNPGFMWKSDRFIYRSHKHTTNSKSNETDHKHEFSWGFFTCVWHN